MSTIITASRKKRLKEIVNSSFRKVIKKGAFPGEQAVFKALYLRITERYKKWNYRPIAN